MNNTRNNLHVNNPVTSVDDDDGNDSSKKIVSFILILVVCGIVGASIYLLIPILFPAAKIPT